jgi:NitT/TauT family transport system substrate-binding protein
MYRFSGRATAFAAIWALTLGLAACGGESGTGDDTIVVNVGYQSKTINTVTAGTLLRDRGTFEAKLAEIGKAKGVSYKVTWQDFPSGPPVTAQMIAGKVDIGSMGDYPIMVNGSKSSEFADARTELVAVTGYNLRGSLNQVVVPVDSPARSLADLRGKVISTSVGSAAHGMLVHALQRTGGMKQTDVQVLNQDPPVGASGLQSKQVAALAQFVPWPQVMVFRGQGRLLYDGGANGVATFHAVVVRQGYATAHPEVMRAFLEAQRETTDYLNANPLDAAQRVADITGMEPEVVYLYNGPNGLVTFDLTIKQPLVEAMEETVPFLKELGSVKELDLGAFVNDSYLRQLYGDSYDTTRADLTNPNKLTGDDPVCQVKAEDPATASEVWYAGENATDVAASPTCLLRQIKGNGGEVRAAYVPDTDTGIRIFAKAAAWVLDPDAPQRSQLLPFATPAEADAYVVAHPGTRSLDYAAALASVTSGGTA